MHGLFRCIIIISGVFAMVGVNADGSKVSRPGIVVGEPKQYPYRYLEEQLDQLNLQLAQIQAVEAAKVLAASGSLQGREIRQSQVSANITANPLPKVETIREPGEEGDLKTTKETTTRDSYTPAPPPPGAGSNLTSPLSNYGIAAQDLLSEQINLQYQANNIRLLLNQSVTDRYRKDGDATGFRRHAIVGFRISLNPEKKHKKKAAVVEITVKPKDAGDSRPGIVSLMPEEKSYNAVALSKKSASFGGAALTGVFTLGVSAGASTEKFFVYKDSDTVAFQRQSTKGSNETTFGWQFRPVLNQTSITPGSRYLFVVLALDAFENDPDPFELEVSAKAYWQKYNSKHRFAKGDMRLENNFYYDPVKLVSAGELEDELAPKVNHADVFVVEQNGRQAEDVLVTVQGESLSRGSRIFIGDSEADSAAVFLNHPADDRMEFVAKAADVLRKDIRIVGSKYGLSTTVVDGAAVDQGVTCAEDDAGFRLKKFTLQPSNQAYKNLKLELSAYCDNSDLEQSGLLGRSVFITVGDEIYETSAESWREENEAGRKFLVRSLEVPAKLFAKDVEIGATIAFMGERFSSQRMFHPPEAILEARQLEVDGNNVIWGLFGYGLDPRDNNGNPLPLNLEIYAGRHYDFERVSDNMLKITGGKDELGKQKKIMVVIPGNIAPTVISAPDTPAPAPKPTLSGSRNAPQNSAKAVEFAGQALTAIKSVEFDGKALPHKAMGSDKLVVFLNREVTKERGPVSLIGHYGENSILVFELLIQ